MKKIIVSGHIYNIIKKEEQILQVNQIGNKHRKHQKQVQHPELDKALYLWIVQQRTKHTPLTSEIVREKARNFHKDICKEQQCAFLASYGWFIKFRSRYGLKIKKMHGEKLSADLTHVESFKAKLAEIIECEELELEEIYNADESALYFKILPNKTIALDSEKKLSGSKAIKDRFTFMPCANATGTHKLDLQIIGTAAMPRCFNKQHPKGVVYNSSKNAWQTKNLFTAWFQNNFIPSVREYAKKRGKSQAKALLLLDNCSAHNNQNEMLSSDDGLINVLFLPPNVTSELQPIDQHVIVCAKNNYRKKMLQFLLVQHESNLHEEVKKFSLLKAIMYLKDAWEMVPPATIFKSWNNLLQNHELYVNHLKQLENDVSLNECADRDTLLKMANKIEQRLNVNETVDQFDVSNWIENDEDFPTSEEYLDHEILRFVRGENIQHIVDEPLNTLDTSEVEEHESLNEPSDAQMLFHIDSLISILDKSQVDKVIFLRSWRDQICNKC